MKMFRLPKARRAVRIVWILFPMVGFARAQGVEEKQIYQSESASRCIEKVRSFSQGTTMAVFVKRGDKVSSGQVLGHTEVDKAKLDYEMARLTMESKANVEAAKSQAEAWRINREEVERAVRKRDSEATRLDWAIAMEEMYQANHGAQLDAEKSQVLQYRYYKDQYEKRFFRAPVEGVVTEILTEPGKPVGLAAHVFTITKDGYFSLPVKVPAPVAYAAMDETVLAVRPAGGKYAGRAVVGEIADDPVEPQKKIVRLLLKAADFPQAVRAKLQGMRFDVLMPGAGDRM